MGRKESREIALHLAFELSFGAFKTEEIVTERLDETVRESLSGDIAVYAGPIPEDQMRYIRDTVAGIGDHLAELDAAIEQYAKNWSVHRLSHMTASILRLALYEMRYVEDVPDGAAINEAVELAKKYESDKAAAFINGVLGSAARDTEPADDAPQAAE